MTSQHDPPTEPVMVTEIVMPAIVEPAGLQTRTRQLPPPGPGEALVAVEASGVSFAEQAMRRGRYPGQPKFPFVPGYDLVGTVQAVGPGVDPAMTGQRVAALTKTGGWATHTILPADHLVRVPAGVDPGEAESFVVNGITAYQMLHRRAMLIPGQTVLVHGANGGVGMILIQLARNNGLRVIGAASPRHHDRLRDLGVEPVDYADIPAMFVRIGELAPDGVDAVFENVGGDTLHRSWAALAAGGVLVSYAISSVVSGTGSVVGRWMLLIARLAWWDRLPNRRRATFYNVWDGKALKPRAFWAQTRTDLTEVLTQLADGRLNAEVGARLPLARAREAMELYESRTVHGKVVLQP